MNLLFKQKLLATLLISFILLIFGGISIVLNSQKAYAANCDKASNIQNNCIVHDINLVIKFLSAIAGMVIVGTIIVGGIQYGMAGDNPQSVSAAKDRIMKGLVALFAFIFIVAILEWLVPGNIISG